MRKVSKISDLITMELKSNLVSTIEEQLNILDESYGTDRDIIAEYVDYIECEGGKQYCLSLFILSSDYAVIVVTTKELMDIIVEE